MRVAVTGATGFVGRALLPALVAAGHEPVALLRPRPGRDAAEFERRVPGARAAVCDPHDAPALARALAGCAGVVNLAGESVMGGRWRPRFLEAVRRSRIATTRALVDAMATLREPPGVLVSASAVGIYGAREPAEELTEDTTELGHDFLAVLCRDWEAAARRAEAGGTRVVRLRIGVVLGRGGGALQKLVTPVRWFVGGRIGHGRQVVSWIHLDDLLRLVCFALDEPGVHGALNATAPGPVSNAELTRQLARTLHRPAVLPVPSFALRALLGRGASVLTTGQRVLPRRALEAGFVFAHPALPAALADLLAPAA